MRSSGGDARRLLNILEMVVSSVPSGKVDVTNQRVKEIIQNTTAVYDRWEKHITISLARLLKVLGQATQMLRFTI